MDLNRHESHNDHTGNIALQMLAYSVSPFAFPLGRLFEFFRGQMKVSPDKRVFLWKPIIRNLKGRFGW